MCFVLPASLCQGLESRLPSLELTPDKLSYSTGMHRKERKKPFGNQEKGGNCFYFTLCVCVCAYACVSVGSVYVCLSGGSVYVHVCLCVCVSWGGFGGEVGVGGLLHKVTRQKGQIKRAEIFT